MRHRLTLILVTLSLMLVLNGCLPAVVATEHEYVLVLAEGEGAYRILHDDDELYHQFDTLVLGDAYLQHLLTVYEHTTEAFLATNKRTALADTVANRPLIVLDSAHVGVVRDLRAMREGQEYRLELAIGLGQATSDDMVAARRALPRALGLALLELAGLPHDDAFAQAEQSLALSSATRAPWALRAGWVAALEARFGAQDPVMLSALKSLSAPTQEQQRRLARYELVDSARYVGTVAPEQSPEAVAILFLRLLGASTPYYPQRHMLWMTNYTPDEYAEAKVLLAINRLTNKGAASVDDLLASYAETFPAERELVTRLAQDVLGR